MAALEYFNKTSSSYHQNQFGATLGGPIWKNKVFFFGDAQGAFISTFVPPQPNHTVPTALERTGDFTEMLDSGNTEGNGSIALYQAGGNVTDTPGGADDPAFAPRYLTCNGVQNVICSPNRLPRRFSIFSRTATRAARTRSSITTPCRPPRPATTQRSSMPESKTHTLKQWFNPCAFKNPPRAVLTATDPSKN